MRTREEILQRIEKEQLICIVRGVYGEDCLNLAKALGRGGIRLLEVTYDQSSEEKRQLTSDTVRLLTDALGDTMDFGAGTVTTAEMLDSAREAGARFIISAHTDKEIIQKTREYGLVSIPGVMTPTEILAAHRYGADFVKLFPAGDLGPSYMKSVLAPFNQIRLLAVGGITLENLPAFRKAGACGFGVGGQLANKEWIRSGAWDKLTEQAARFCEAVKG